MMESRHAVAKDLEHAERYGVTLEDAARLYLRALAIADPQLMRRCVALMKVSAK